MKSAKLGRAVQFISHKSKMMLAGHAERLKDLLHHCETVQERIWEWKHYLFPDVPSDGEMTALLRRNGWTGFYAFLIKQKRGDFGRRNFLPSNRIAVVNRLRTEHPEEVDRIIRQAERLQSGEYDLLGSGPVDMRRGKSGPGYAIDWRRDPISGESYTSVFSHWRWNPFVFRRGNADVKGPWELTRCQHFPLLGQAYWLTNDERYANLYAQTILDFIRHNPPGLGVHWACPMDVSLRMISWMAGLSFFQGSKALGFGWWRKFLKSLVQHGRHVAHNLEFGTLNGKIIVSNHGLTNLFGLYWLALNFSGLDAGCVWRGFAESGLEHQITLQVLDDGGCFESSIPYHRLVTEIFLSAYVLSVHHRQPLSETYRTRLLLALRFIKSLRQVGGRQPQIGDADNGRGHIFSGYGAWESEQENMDHLLVAGALVLGCPELAADIDPRYGIEEIFWRDPGDPEPIGSTLPSVEQAQFFPNSGLAVLRNNATYVLMSNSECGTFGIGNHKHNDQLSIEWVLGDQPMLVDAGSYTYTQDPEARNYFRSTRNHNTLQIDDHEQNGLDPLALFRLVQHGTPSWEAIQQDVTGAWGVRAMSTAYSRLSESAVHIRSIIVTAEGQFIIDDRIEGPGDHGLRWCFVIHPSVEAELSENKVILKGSRTAVFEAPDWAVWSLEPAWYSRGYGVRQPTQAMVLNAQSIRRAVFIARELNDVYERNSLIESHSPSAINMADRFWKNDFNSCTLRQSQEQQ